MSGLGPVSAALEADLRTFVRRHGVAMWLDLDGHYTAFVDGLVAMRAAGELPYEVHGFRGSHLDLMFALESAAAGAEPSQLVIHLPGFNEESVKATPLFELYAAGTRYRKALDTLVTEAAGGSVKPEQIAAFRGHGAFTLDGADAWLATLLHDDDDGDAGGGLAAHLRAMRPVAVIDDLLAGGVVAGRVANASDLARLWERLEAWTGLPATAREPAPAGTPAADHVAFTTAGWAACVEYVDDLQREPVASRLVGIRALPRQVIDTCREIAAHLRDRHPTFYRRTADETEAGLVDEVAVAKAEDLGKIDTFRFEEDRILEAALKALADQQWPAAAEWADLRLDGDSFWLRGDPSRRSTWQLVRAAARLGRTIAEAGPLLDAKGGCVDQAVEHYVERGAGVDEAHRHLEQQRVALLYPQLPEFDALRDRLDDLRSLWRDWADAWARDFSALCGGSGFLPSAPLQQRTLFAEVVRPFTQEPGITAYFVVDALRYEMGRELFRALAETPATAASLRPRLAELPTVTEVGMNVLAPVVDNGRLRPVIHGSSVQGFATGEFRVSDPETRRRAMYDRVGGDTCPWLTLEDVVSRDSTSLKQAVARARLVVVHSQEIDNAGEKGVGPAVFDHVLQKLRAAWRLLRDAGVRRFVITADHGYLLLDETSRTVQAHGRKIDPHRRHVLSTVEVDRVGEARVALADLGYDGAAGSVIFPETTAVFDTGRRSMSFVHGGNSLQERVIPVITLVHRSGAGTSTVQYSVAAKAREDVAGMHSIEAKVDVAQGALAFGGTREVELALRVPDVQDVHVELCQTRGGARVAGALLVANVGESFELFFRLLGAADARVRVQLVHPTAEVDIEPCVVDGRFGVTPGRPGSVATTPAGGTAAPETSGRTWLDDLPSGEVRQLFAHLQAHGAITEGEAAAMLGGQRALRRFALRFDELATKAPFDVHIEVVAGVKRYVRNKG